MSVSFPPTLRLAQDLALSLSGDLLLGPDGDLDCVHGEDVLLQEIVVRLKTRKGDARYAPEMGASLDTLIGQPNAPETGLAAEKLVLSALTHDGLFTASEVSVFSQPTSPSTISLSLAVNMARYGSSSSGNVLSLDIDFDLQEGLLL